MLKKKEKTIYKIEKLIPGERIGLEGWFAAVPEKGYKGHPFRIVYMTSTKDASGEWHYSMIEQQVKDWNKAVMFRKQPNQFKGGGFFTLGYFRMEGV